MVRAGSGGSRKEMSMSSITDTLTGRAHRVCRMYRVTSDPDARLAVTEDRRVWIGYPKISSRWSHIASLGDRMSGETMTAENARCAANMW